MITAIEIENFRGFGERQRIELAPITLLFGQNSSGKTAVIQSLLFAHEIFVERSPMPHRSTLGGRFVDFGSFRQLIFNGQVDKTISIKIEMSFPWNFPNFWNQFGYDTDEFDCDPKGKVDSVALEVMVGWSSSEGGFLPKVYQFIAGDHPVVTVAYPDKGGSYTTRRELFEDVTNTHFGLADAEITLHGDHPIRPSVSELKTRQTFRVKTQGMIPNHPDFIGWFEQNANQQEPDEPTKRYFTGWLEGISNQLTKHLEGLACLGPLRDVPVDFVPRFHQDKSRVANGLSAWDGLGMSGAEELERCNRWIGKEGLDTGYQLKRIIHVPHEIRNQESDQGVRQILVPRKDRISVPGNFIDQSAPSDVLLVLEDLGDKSPWLKPSSVGTGISQIVPVVFHSLVKQDLRLFSPRLLTVEQPELHLHPRAQTRLGDLFLHAFDGFEDAYSPYEISDNQLIAETHSEHLLLRILRRVRETTEGELPKGIREVTPSEISVYYLDRSANGIVATRLRVDESGEFIDRWPKGFFEERAEELF